MEKTSDKTTFIPKNHFLKGFLLYIPVSNQSKWKLTLAIALLLVAGIILLLPSSLPTPARITIFTFLLAGILWSTTSINAGYIALSSVILLLLTGVMSQKQFFESLGSDVVWLMIGAFILGGAVQETGLAVRLTQMVASKAHNVRSLFWMLTSVLIPLSFLIPSTSGRAAVTYPIFRSISSAVDDKQTRRALCLLMPTIILVSTIASLTGAGSHLIAKDLLQEITQQNISFGQWVLYGLPFAAVASYASCWVITWMFLDKKRLQRQLKITQIQPQPLSSNERKTLLIILLMFGLWLTEAWHGLETATVIIMGALLLTAPNFGVMKWKDAVKAISWNLIIFVAATHVLGHSLITSGASKWILKHIFDFSHIDSTGSHFIVLLVLAIISLTSHLYMTSHTARAAALVPPLLYLGISLDVNPVAVLFLITLGMDYCLTFPVSSKALIVYQDMDAEGFRPQDLLRLSTVMIPIHFGLIILFYYTWWNWVGLSF
ncbi:SLC13 family permease [Calothrix sp. UHCC 0171]|uniref:SLC13 family permease n=1 Tax=Calothrix sp. UHCC 0171 TaxID=3110245 RepID=UPI002B1F88E2|nr:SLC13 family permease [Calothrix sp. UHCC 0171]MEA5573062.1 SLC13 family permease [Calothrix sp. UHCC 0171]